MWNSFSWFPKNASSKLLVSIKFLRNLEIVGGNIFERHCDWNQFHEILKKFVKFFTFYLTIFGGCPASSGSSWIVTVSPTSSFRTSSRSISLITETEPVNSSTLSKSVPYNPYLKRKGAKSSWNHLSHKKKLKKRYFQF